jgi:hypothetical protein
MDMRSFADSLCGSADGMSIFDDMFVSGKVAQGDFVSEGDVFDDGDGAYVATLKSDGGHSLSGLDVTDCNADIVFGFMDENRMVHARTPWSEINTGIG